MQRPTNIVIFFDLSKLKSVKKRRILKRLLREILIEKIKVKMYFQNLNCFKSYQTSIIYT